MASATSRLDRDPWIEDLNATSSLSYLSKLLSTLFLGEASLNATGPASSRTNERLSTKVSKVAQDPFNLTRVVAFLYYRSPADLLSG
ncbi:hypothetical protein Tco_0170419 [Tanacetum coccineum]